MLPELAAERQLLAVEAALAPHIPDHNRRSLVNRYLRRVSGEQRHKSAHEALLAAGITVKHFPISKPEEGDGTGRDETKG